MTNNDILNLISSDQWRMSVLLAVAELGLPDWAIAAGFVRGLVWDHLHGYGEQTPLTDVDVVYFDPSDGFDGKELEARLAERFPGLEWDIKNMAVMHIKNGDAPYASMADAIAHWPDTATAVGVTLHRGELELVAPLGIEDLVNVIARPTPAFAASPERMEKMRERFHKKNWQEKWPKVRLVG